MIKASIYKYSILSLSILILMALMPAIASSSSVSTSITTIASTSTTTSTPTTIVKISSTTTIPYLILPTSVKPSNSSGNVKVAVSGVGFTPGTLVNLGYLGYFPPYNHSIYATTTSSTGNWSGSFSAPWNTGYYTMIAIDAKGVSATRTFTVTTTSSNTTTTVPGCPIHVPSTTTIIYPEIIFPNHVYPSNSSNKFTINVEGGGFHQNSTIVFGYQPSSNTSRMIINARSDCNGNWNGTFNAPWETGSYSMYAQDAQGAIANANLIVTKRTPTIILPPHVVESNSLKLSIVNVTGYGFAPDTYFQFGYFPIPPYTNVKVDGITNGNGDWNGSFSAPWANGNYNMVGTDSGVSVTNAILVVATTTTAITSVSTTTIP